MSKKEALIIFVRKPELGKVKTRIAATEGDEAALAIYKKLLEHTYSITSVLSCDKYVFYTNVVEEADLWSNGFYKRLQATGDLGEKMRTAFEQLFQEGHNRVCIVGSDCFELTSDILESAFHQLNSHDLVIGPAKDGGYYLLGMKDKVKEVFRDVEWSTEKVFEQTKRRIERHQYTYALLPLLNDVDTIEDVPAAFLAELGSLK